MENIFSTDKIEKWDALLKKATHVVLTTHTNPDGDAIGSVTGLCSYLKDREIDVKIICPNAYPSFLQFLDIDSEIIQYQGNEKYVAKVIENTDLIIALDVCGFSRLDKLGELLVKKPVDKILIDHHPGPSLNEFKLIFSHTQVSSTCELVCSLLSHWNCSVDITAAQATSFLTGMYTDTNKFANSVYPNTFSTASELIRMGADYLLIMKQVYGSYTFNRMRLLGYALQKMILLPEYSAGYIVLSAAELEQFDFQDGDTEGFANLPLSIDGISVAALFLEKKDFIKVSLRSIGARPVNGIAEHFFNGGGHFNAAAGRIKMSIQDMGTLFEEALGTIIA